MNARCCNPRWGAPGRLAVFSMTAVGSALLADCTNEQITAIDVDAVTVTPAAANALLGEQVPLTAAVRDAQGNLFHAVAVTWESENPDVATVDESGTVVTLAPGLATVRAAFEGVSGTAAITVFPGPSIEVSHPSVALYAGTGDSPPSEQTVHITNGGLGEVAGLSVSVSYPGSAGQDWLRAALGGTAAPTALTLAADAEGLSRGVHEALLTIAADAVANSPVQVPVTLALTSFAVSATGGGTVVSESGTADHLDVQLQAPPTSAVVLSIASTDPGETRVSPSSLTFTASDWQQARRLTVTGVDDASVDGSQTSEIRVSVDAAQSDDAFDDIPEHRAAVVTEDDDEGESGPGIWIGIGGDGPTLTESAGPGRSGTFQVSLRDGPAAPVVVAVTSTNLLEVVVASAPILTFRPDDWGTPRLVTVTAVDDFLPDGDRTVDVLVTVIDALSDGGFHGLVEVVKVRTLDDDGLSLGVSSAAPEAPRAW